MRDFPPPPPPVVAFAVATVSVQSGGGFAAHLLYQKQMQLLGLSLRLHLLLQEGECNYLQRRRHRMPLLAWTQSKSLYETAGSATPSSATSVGGDTGTAVGKEVIDSNELESLWAYGLIDLLLECARGTHKSSHVLGPKWLWIASMYE